MSPSRPTCFVAMPFGTKTDAVGATVEFDAIYAAIIAPAIDEAGLEPIRADEERIGGIIHKPMFERLLLCEYAVADLTTANANVFYELGIRHAFRPWSTVLLFAAGSRLPFDIAVTRGLPYQVGPTGLPTTPDADRAALALALRNARDRTTDSPLFQLLDGLHPAPLDQLSTEVFRERVDDTRRWKERIAGARAAGAEPLRALEAELGPLGDVEPGILVDLLLSYRAVSAYAEMGELVGRLPEQVAATAMVQEQYAFALTRTGDRTGAERVLTTLLAARGASSETYGLLGRVYKDQWADALARGDEILAHGLREKALDTYLKGFETDWRDAYPGVNAATLMLLAEPVDPRLEALLPVVSFAAERRAAGPAATYWDHASRLEVAALRDDEPTGRDAAGRALAIVREPWEPETTARNLRLIREAHARRGRPAAWLGAVEQALVGAAA